MDDSAPVHRGKNVRKWKQESGIISLFWPSRSPDLNIIENVWAFLQDELYNISEELHSPDDAWREAKRIWYDIPTTFIEKLYQSLPKRVEELQKNGRGIITK